MKRKTTLKILGIILFIPVLCIIIIVTINIAESHIPQVEPFALSEPLELTEQLAIISPENINNLQEIGGTLSNEGQAKIIAIAQMENNIFEVVDSQGGFYKICENNEAQFEICGTDEITQAEEGWVTFSADGSLLIYPSGLNGNEVKGFVLWDILENQIVYQSSDWEGYVTTGFYLDPTGRIVVDYAYDGMKITDWENNYGYGVASFEETTDPYPNIEKITIDSRGEYLAIAYDTGQVVIGNIEKGNYLVGNNKDYQLAPNSVIIDVVDMEFDPSRKFIAWMTDNELLLINLQRLIFPTVVRSQISQGKTLSFDRSGRLLVAGLSNSIVFYDTTKGKEIYQIDVSAPITSIFFSRDGRVLIWGNAVGQIGFLGIPEEAGLQE